MVREPSATHVPAEGQGMGLAVPFGMHFGKAPLVQSCFCASCDPHREGFPCSFLRSPSPALSLTPSLTPVSASGFVLEASNLTGLQPPSA